MSSRGCSSSTRYVLLFILCSSESPVDSSARLVDAVHPAPLPDPHPPCTAPAHAQTRLGYTARRRMNSYGERRQRERTRRETKTWREQRSGAIALARIRTVNPRSDVACLPPPHVVQPSPTHTHSPRLFAVHGTRTPSIDPHAITRHQLAA